MAVCEFDILTGLLLHMENGKRDCRNYWRYASLAVNRGAIKQGFTVFRDYDVIGVFFSWYILVQRQKYQGNSETFVTSGDTAQT